MKEKFIIVGKVRKRSKVALMLFLICNFCVSVFSQKMDSISVANSLIDIVRCEKMSSFLGLNKLNEIDSLDYSYLNSKNIEKILFIKIKVRKYKYIKERMLNINGITSYDTCARALKDTAFFNNILSDKYPNYNLKSNSDLEKILYFDLGRNSIHFNCDYILAYSLEDGFFFKLKGFRNLDYKEFIGYLSKHSGTYLSLELKKKISRISSKKFVKLSKAISKYITVDDIDFNEIHRWANRNFEIKSAPCSCFQKEEIYIR
ncbi:MAG: hypothetical protein IT237_08730 [Bacteroidia bacterium]|nr:hypothetical protein [Bacteroidia bacterium]